MFPPLKHPSLTRKSPLDRDRLEKGVAENAVRLGGFHKYRKRKKALERRPFHI